MPSARSRTRPSARVFADAREAVDVLDEWPVTRLEAVRRTLDDASSVAGVLRLQDRAMTAADRAAEGAQATARAETSLRESGVSVPASGWMPPDLGEGWLQEALDALRDAEGAARDVETARSRVDRATTQHETATRRHAAAQAQAREADETFTRATQEHRRLGELAGQMPDPFPARAIATRLQRELGRRPALVRALAVAEESDATALSAYAHAERDVLTLREARLAGIAGELGAALLSDEPCPVCGSVEHPTPAAPAADAPSPERIEAAENRASQAEASRLAAGVALTTARERLHHLDETITVAHDELRGSFGALAQAIAAVRGESDPPQLRHLAAIDAVAARLQDGQDGQKAPAGQHLALDEGADLIADVVGLLDDVAATRDRLADEVERASAQVAERETVRAQAVVARSAAEERCASTRDALLEADATCSEALEHLAEVLHAVPPSALHALGLEWDAELLRPATEPQESADGSVSGSKTSSPRPAPAV